MDFWSIVILLSIIASGLLMIIGPLMEVRGKILFLEAKQEPKTSGRWGMGLMLFAFIIFVAGLILRSILTSSQVSPLVLGGFALWFVGGIIAVIRNETLKIMEASSEAKEDGKGGDLNESSNF